MKEISTLPQTAASERSEKNGHSTAGLLRGAAIAAGIGLATVATARRAAAQTKPSLTFANIPGTGDVKVLQYALALETLEANLYVQAIARLNALGVSGSDAGLQYVQKFAQIEADHRDFLFAALTNAGIAPVTAPGQALGAASFDFGINSLDANGVLNLLYVVENTGTKAYLGAIQFFDTKTYLAVAGGIQATEARHTATVAALLLSRGVRTDLQGNPIVTAPLSVSNNGIDPISLTPDNVLAAVSGPNGFIVLNASN